MAAMQLEAHPLSVQHGQPCPYCNGPTLVVTVAIAASASLRLLTSVTAEHCPACDTTTVTR